MTKRSSGELARIAGWTSLASLGSLIGFVVLRRALALGPLAPFTPLFEFAVWFATVATVISALGAVILGLTSVVSGRDRGDGLIGLGAAIPAVVVTAGIAFLLVVLLTSDQSFYE